MKRLGMIDPPEVHPNVKRLEDRKIRVELSEKAKDLIIEEAYDPIYGARPLKRTIQRRILDPLAVRVLQGDFREGDTVLIDAQAGALSFNKVEASVRRSLPRRFLEGWFVVSAMNY